MTSSFEYFPGLPIFRSTDLAGWTQIGHAIERESQLDLSSVPSSGGLFAPTIRHHDGVFYIVNTLVHGDGKRGNFLVTAPAAAGPWSDPIWLDDAPGIDPSLLFDDGRAWLCATRLADPGLWDGQTNVWLRELDRETMRLVGDERVIWRGALVGARWAEGPHIYRIGDRYLLVAAEGGTERNHAISVAVSNTVTGPYVGNPANPVLTHRNLGSGEPIVGVGHADLVETPDGEWWAVLLATRTVNGTASMLGRETNLVPVTWEAGWPVFAPGIGRVQPIAAGPEAPPIATPRDDFDDPVLGLDWNLVRTSDRERFSLTARAGWLRLPLLRTDLTGVGAPALVARRVRHLRSRVRTLLDFSPRSAREEAGLVLRQSEDVHITVAVLGDDSGGRLVRAVKRVKGLSTTLGQVVIGHGEVELGISLAGDSCELDYRCGDDAGILAATGCAELSSDAAGGFLGVWAGMFATASGTDSTAVADFDWFDYHETKAH